MEQPEHYDELEVYEQKPSKLKRALIIVVGVFLLMLILSYFLLAETVIGIIGSRLVENNTLETNEYTIIFTNNTLEQLQQNYVENEHREIKDCLYGEIDNTTYIVERLTFPEVIDSSVVHIRTAGCDAEPIISLHSHPINKCLASDQDIENHKSRKIINEKLLMVIMCGKKRFSVVDL